MKKLMIENFKSFRNPTEIMFSDITLNVGMNSVGKSTVTQSLLLLRQLYERRRELRMNSSIIYLNGFMDLELGRYKDVVSDTELGIHLSVDDEDYYFAENANSYNVTSNDSSSRGIDSFFKDDFYYINAERVGPRNFNELTENDNIMCGIHGEYTFEVLARNYLSSVSDNKIFSYEGKSSINKTLSGQVEAWMSFFVPGVLFSANESPESRIATMRIRQTTVDTDLSSPYNYGFGISYLLSIVVTCLVASQGATIIIENPEAHLHPAGQSHVGYFLAQMMNAGLKLVIETHSEHLINGLRLYCLKNNISANKVCINYFSLAQNGTEVQRINLSDDMEILNWPEGFFDQEERDLFELRRIRRNNANKGNTKR